LEFIVFVKASKQLVELLNNTVGHNGSKQPD